MKGEGLISKTAASHVRLEVLILQFVEKTLNNMSEDRRLLHSKTRNQKKKNKEKRPGKRRREHFLNLLDFISHVHPANSSQREAAQQGRSHYVTFRWTDQICYCASPPCGSPQSAAVFNQTQPEYRRISCMLSRRFIDKLNNRCSSSSKVYAAPTHTHTGHSTHTLSGELLTPPTLTQDQSEPPTGRTGGEGGSRGGRGATM